MTVHRQREGRGVVPELLLHVSRATALEIVEILARLEAMNPDDTKAIEGWKRLRDAAPKVWEAMKPVASTVIGEAVKKALGL